MDWLRKLFGNKRKVKVSTTTIPFEQMPPELRAVVENVARQHGGDVTAVMRGGPGIEDKTVVDRNTRLMALQIVRDTNPGHIPTDKMIVDAAKLESYIVDGKKPPMLTTVEGSGTEKP
jgi:hypothetical protein